MNQSKSRVGYLAEVAAIKELVERGFHVAVPVVDDDGVDLVVDYHITVQVKGSRKKDRISGGGYFFCLNRSIYRSEDDLADVLMCFGRDEGVWWIISRDDLASVGLHGRSTGLSLTTRPQRQGKYTRLSQDSLEAWDVFTNSPNRRCQCHTKDSATSAPSPPGS